MKMPFGKYQDVELTDVPQSYLRWLRGQKWLGPWLVKAIDDILEGGPAGRAEATDDDNRKPWAGDRKKGGAFAVVRFGNVGQDIVDEDGKLIAWTTDPWTAQVICKFLNENEELLRSKEKRNGHQVFDEATAHCGQ